MLDVLNVDLGPRLALIFKGLRLVDFDLLSDFALKGPRLALIFKGLRRARDFVFAEDRVLDLP